MAATPEKKVKEAVVKILKEFNAYYFYPVLGGFGSSGVPDIVACFNGRFIGIECKAGKNEPTALQKKNLKAIEFNGGIPMIVNETNIEDVREVLDAISD